MGNGHCSIRRYKAIAFVCSFICSFGIQGSGIATTAFQLDFAILLGDESGQNKSKWAKRKSTQGGISHICPSLSLLDRYVGFPARPFVSPRSAVGNASPCRRRGMPRGDDLGSGGRAHSKQSLALAVRKRMQFLQQLAPLLMVAHTCIDVYPGT